MRRLDVLVSVALCWSWSVGAGAADDRVFDRWAESHAVPLSGIDAPADGSDFAALKSSLASARVVAFGEATHNTHELLALRNRLFRFLVEQAGFTAIALESGFTESLRAGAYLERGEGDVRAVAGHALSRGLDRHAENIELLRWIREYNAAAKAAGRRQIRLYGMDITAGGRPDGAWQSLDWALAYLSLAAPEAAQRIRDTWTAHLPKSSGPFGPLGVGAQRDFEAGIEAVALATKSHRAALVTQSSQRDYRAALRNIEAARQLARCLPVTPGTQVKAKAWIPAVICRDREMAANAKWALENEGPNGRLLVFAANEHVMSWLQDGRHLADANEKPPMMGAHLRRAYGTRYYVIASTFSTAAPELGSPMPSERSLDRPLSSLHRSPVVLDTRSARADPRVRSWLAMPQGLSPNLGAAISVVPATAFDALLYVERLTPAITLSTRE